MNPTENESEDSSAKKLKVFDHSQDQGPSNSKSEGNGFETELNGVASAEFELIDSNSSGSLEDGVFKIPHILELIMANLEKGALLNCRLVSPRWASCALEKLQKIVNICFVNCRPEQRGTFVLEAHPERSMEDFITFINSCTQFPFTSFSFFEKKYSTPSWSSDSDSDSYSDSYSYRDIEVPSAIPFFNIHGPLITKLCLVDHIISFNDLWMLLSSKAPNLQHLELFHVNKFEFQCNNFGNQNYRLHILFDKCENFEEQRQSLKSILDETPCESKLMFKNLKVFKCVNTINDAVILRVLDCAPNLVEVFVSPGNLHVLLKPTNRLHLVKEFVFKIEHDFQDFKSLEQVINHHENKLLLQKVCCIGDPGFYFPKTGTTMNGILTSCSATLENLTWIDYSERFAAPQMPQVKCLAIGYLQDLIGLLLPSRVPVDVSLGQTYPNLKSLIILKTEAAMKNMKNISIKDFFPDQIPLPTVTNVSVHFAPRQILFRGLRKMFPNAHINVKVG